MERDGHVIVAIGTRVSTRKIKCWVKVYVIHETESVHTLRRRGKV